VHNGAGPANERAGQGAIESEQETTKTTRERDESKESESKVEEGASDGRASRRGALADFGVGVFSLLSALGDGTQHLANALQYSRAF